MNLASKIANKVIEQVEGTTSDICCDVDFEGITYFITGFVHCQCIDETGGSDEFGNSEQLSRCIGCDPFLVVTWFDDDNEENFVDTTAIEIEIKNHFVQ